MVLLSIADQKTREATQFSRHKSYGLLYGTQKGFEIDITQAFELPVEEKSIDTGFLQSTTEICKAYSFLFLLYPSYTSCSISFVTSVTEVNPNSELLGWYATETELDEDIKTLHQQVSGHC